MKTYLVGGAVRDMVMGIEPKDRDYVVVGATPQQMIDLGYEQVGADFPVFLHPVTKEEYALARIERKTGIGYHGFKAVFDVSVTLEQDLYRRDLTINSMAYDMETKTLIDPYGGVDDIHRNVIKHTSDHFQEDPLRILRVARFAARYPLMRIDESTLGMMTRMMWNGMLDELPTERIWKELSRGLSENDPARMIQVLVAIGGAYAKTLVSFIDPHFDYHRAKQYFDYFKTIGLEKNNNDILLAILAGCYKHDYHNPHQCFIDLNGKNNLSRPQKNFVLRYMKQWVNMVNYHTLDPNTRREVLQEIGIIGSNRTSHMYQNVLALLEADMYLNTKVINHYQCTNNIMLIEYHARLINDYNPLHDNIPPKEMGQAVHNQTLKILTINMTDI